LEADIVRSTIIYWLSRPIIGLYGRLLKLNVHRKAQLPKGPKIITANHPSTSDPFLISYVTREPSRMLVIGHAFDVPGFGAYLRAAGHIPVVEGEGYRAFEMARAHLQEGGTLVMFPEGHLSPKEGGFMPPHTGAARLALLTGAPIIPMGISLSPRGLWYVESDIGSQWVTSRWALRGPYGVTVGHPLHFNGKVEDRVFVKRVSRWIMRHISDLAHESQERLQAPYLWPTILEPLVPAR
jgi:1-acyl-sn-glycerol-3-phosphate acyltransferase